MANQGSTSNIKKKTSAARPEIRPRPKLITTKRTVMVKQVRPSEYRCWVSWPNPGTSAEKSAARELVITDMVSKQERPSIGDRRPFRDHDVPPVTRRVYRAFL